MNSKDIITIFLTAITIVASFSVGVYKYLETQILNKNQLSDQNKINANFEAQHEQITGVMAEQVATLQVIQSKLTEQDKKIEKLEDKQYKNATDISRLQGKIK